MKIKLDMIGIVTANFEKMLSFYKDVLGFEVLLQMENDYVEFKNDGVRFALTSNKIMAEATGQESFREQKQGESFELAFKADSPAEVDRSFAEILEKGATKIKDPADMPWQQRTAFFADPDGNIHEIFADLPEAK